MRLLHDEMFGPEGPEKRGFGICDPVAQFGMVDRQAKRDLPAR